MEINFKGKKKKYRLSSDEKQFCLYEVVTAKSGKNKGETTYSPIGYYADLEQVFKKCLHLEINDSDAITFNDLFQAISDTKTWIDTLVSENSKPQPNQRTESPAA